MGEGESGAPTGARLHDDARSRARKSRSHQWREQARPPHFHVRYAGEEASFTISPLEFLAGSLPGRARSMTIEWGELHLAELMEDWVLAQSRRPLKPIEPLR